MIEFLQYLLPFATATVGSAITWIASKRMRTARVDALEIANLKEIIEIHSGTVKTLQSDVAYLRLKYIECESERLKMMKNEK